MSTIETTVGDEIRFKVPVTEADGTTPIALSYGQHTLRFTAKRRASDTVTELEADSTNSGAGSGQGVITFNGSEATVRIPKELTGALPAPSALVWDMQMNDGSSRWTIEAGVVVVEPQVTAV